MNSISYYIRYFTQLISISILKLLVFRPHIKTKRVSDIKKYRHYLIAANHRHALDPFYIACSFQFHELIRILPFAIMTANRFYYPPLLRIPAWLGGCFPTHGPCRTHGVDGAIRLIERGYTVLVFPEGKRISTGTGTAKPGISRIIEGVPQAPLLLIHIEWQKPPRYASIGFRRTTHIENDPKAILDSIYEI